MPRNAIRSVFETILIFLCAIALAIVLQAYAIKPFLIPSESMVPTIDPSDRILVNRLAYRFGDIERGDIIVFKSPKEPEVDFVKRVIALPGDTVEVKLGKVILNGELQEEPHIKVPDSSNFPSQTVPEGMLFVMGDNRGNSDDSRLWTPPWLPIDNVVGEAFFMYWPLDRIRLM